MAKRKSKIKKKKSDTLTTFVRDYQKAYQFYQRGSLFLLNKGLYVVKQRRRIWWKIRKSERDYFGNVRTIIQKERRLKLWFKRVYLRGRIANGDIKLMSKVSKARVLKYLWLECN